MPLILVVDDEPGVRSHACQTLEAADYHTVAAASANEAREVVGLVTPDLLILDVRLTDFSGIEFALQVQQAHPRLPVLFISGWLDELPETMPPTALRHAFLAKPYTDSALVQAARQLLTPEKAS